MPPSPFVVERFLVPTASTELLDTKSTDSLRETGDKSLVNSVPLDNLHFFPPSLQNLVSIGGQDRDFGDFTLCAEVCTIRCAK